MNQGRNAEVARALWEAIAEGDPGEVAALLAPDVVWTVPGENELAGCFRGPDEVIDFLARAGEAMDEMRSNVGCVMSDADCAVLIHHVSARRDEKRLEMDFFLLLRVAGGRILSVVSVPFDQAVVDDFWH